MPTRFCKPTKLAAGLSNTTPALARSAASAVGPGSKTKAIVSAGKALKGELE